MNQYDLMAKLPTKPSKTLIAKMKTEFNNYNDNYIIFRFTKTKAKCFCTKCRQNFEVSKDFIETATVSARIYLCPKCSCSTVYIHTSKISRFGNIIRKCFPITIKKINKHGGIIEWSAYKKLYKDGRIEISIKPTEAYFLIGRKLYKFVKYYTGLWGSIIFLDNWEIRSRSVDTLLQSSVVLPFSEKYLNGTELENAKLDLFCKVEKPYIVQYIKTYQKHKNIENLVKSGYAEYVNNIFENEYNNNYYYHYASQPEKFINFREKKPYKMLGFSNKQEFEFLKGEKFEKISLLSEIKKIDENFNYKFLDEAANMNAQVLCNERFKGISFEKVLNYLKRQLKKVPDDEKNLINCIYYKDFIVMADELGYDDCFPKDLIKAHDKLVERRTTLQNRSNDVKIKERYKQLKKFCFSSGGLTIHPAMCATEFVNEGNKLHHCVATYIKRHADAKTNIFFIRRADKPQKPFYTLELNLNNLIVVQNRGLYNCARTDEIIKFEEEFLNFVKETIRKENKDGRNHNLRSECA